MNIYFLDASSLIKRYQPEEGSDKIEEVFSKEDSERIIANFSIAEVLSAFYRLLHGLIPAVAPITPEELQILKRDFFRDIVDGRIKIVNLTNQQILNVEVILKEKHLKAFDALQLTIAYEIFQQNPDIKFVCADDALKQSAEKMGLEVIDPLAD